MEPSALTARSPSHSWKSIKRLEFDCWSCTNDSETKTIFQSILVERDDQEEKAFKIVRQPKTKNRRIIDNYGAIYLNARATDKNESNLSRRSWRAGFRGVRSNERICNYRWKWAKWLRTTLGAWFQSSLACYRRHRARFNFFRAHVLMSRRTRVSERASD